MTLKRIIVVAAVAALAVPGAAVAKGGPSAKADKGTSHAKVQKAKSQKAKSKARAKSNPRVTLVAKGDVVSIDEAANTMVVKVVKTNKHGRALVGEQRTVDVSAAKLSVADRNADGTLTTADFAADDKVLVQVRVAKRAPAPEVLNARKVVNKTAPEVEETEVEQPAVEQPAA